MTTDDTTKPKEKETESSSSYSTASPSDNLFAQMNAYEEREMELASGELPPQTEDEIKIETEVKEVEQADTKPFGYWVTQIKAKKSSNISVSYFNDVLISGYCREMEPDLSAKIIPDFF